jgi:hypothetical protein
MTTHTQENAMTRSTERPPIRLNKVDVEVRKLLLAFPMLYRDRLDALRHVFGNSGYHWDEDGCLRRRDEIERATDVMNFADLDEDDAANAKRAGDMDMDVDSDVIGGLHRMRLHEARVARALRGIVAADIDVVATELPMDATVGYERMENMTLYPFDPIDQVPWGRIDADWLAALEEFLDRMQVSFNHTFHVHIDTLPGRKPPEPSMVDRMPAVHRRLYDRLQEIGERAEAQSGTRARAEAWMESGGFKAIMARIQGLND